MKMTKYHVNVGLVETFKKNVLRTYIPYLGQSIFNNGTQEIQMYFSPDYFLFSFTENYQIEYFVIVCQQHN